MHARITTLQSTPHQISGLKRKVERSILPILRLQPGFKRLLILGDTDGKLVTLTLWGTESDEQATFGRECLHSVLDDTAMLLLHSSRSDSYDVLIASDGL